MQGRCLLMSCFSFLWMLNLHAQQRNIEIDFGQSKGPHPKFFNTSIGTGRANTLLRSGHQQHIVLAAKECGFKYLRFHGIYQDDMGVYRENKNGQPFYSWQYVDEVYDFIVGAGLRPIIVFDFMPEALASGSKTIYWEKANITPPKNYDRWHDLVKATVRHFADRYGVAEVREWLFEVWNEPDGYFFDGKLEDYLKLYDYTAKAVKAVSPDFRVGGPAIAGNVDWIKSLIDHCKRESISLDFISVHAYSTKQVYEDSVYKKLPDPDYIKRIPVWKPGTPWTMGNVAYNPVGIAGGIKNVVDVVRSSAMAELPVWYTEWGLTWDYWDPMRDSYQAASHLLSNIKRADPSVKALSFCELSDVFEEDGPPTADFHGGFGLINLQGIRKPAYFAYKYLNQLGKTELLCADSNAIACKNDRDLQLLFWNDAVRQTDVNKIYYAQVQPALKAGTARVVIKGLAAGTYRYQLHGVGYRKNDAYSAYLDMHVKESLSKTQVASLQAQTTDKVLQSGTFEVKKNVSSWSYEIPVEENDVYLLNITPAR